MFTVPNSDVKSSNFFRWGELLNLPQWKRFATAEDGLTEEILDNLNKLSLKMDDIRRFLNCPVNVHSAYRSPEYSKLVGGSETDVHTQGLAMDFDVLPIFTCDQVKEKLLPKLDELNIRMENNGLGSGWIHIDIKDLQPGHKRYFNA